ncbi:type I-C CRISPR-associated protein Cas8c/Csd1 [Nocardioides sp. NPDC057577]|uniref:type I-C CRISPR-associated protein Cas8c/Csd1 n=1 Tax=Nocardioides sp. NPDC057577 TaxID=3346171 RepID=UPI0036719056
MLLRALTEYADSGDQVPTGYARKPLGFVFHIDDDAAGCQIFPRHHAEETSGGKRRAIAPTATVPNIARTSKVMPLLACDNAPYVLGRSKIESDPAKQAAEDKKAAAKRQAFDNLLREYAEAADDDDARIFLRWRENGSPGLDDAVGALDAFSAKRLETDLIAISVGSSMQMHGKASARQFWSTRATELKSSGRTQVCLACGDLKPTVETLPQFLIGSMIPATTTSNVALISVNFSAASRGASGKGLKSAPICSECAAGAVSAFNALAGDRKHRWGGRSEDRATIWWTTDDHFDFNTLEQPNPEQVADFLTALDKGRAPVGGLDQDDRFYALTFSGNVARLVVRQWIDLPLLDVHANVLSWFDNSAAPDIEKPHSSLSEMARSCGGYVPSDGFSTDLPEGSREALIRCALTGSSLPPNLLPSALRRARAEVHYQNHSDARVVGVVRHRWRARFGLIRLTLNRTYLKEKPLSQYLDESRTEPAYLSGRLFAVRESLQYAALGEVNASIRDRYFERASSHPASVEHALSALEVQHLRVLRRKGAKGAEIATSKRIDDLHARCGAAPGRLSTEDQALWIAGYYQQRQARFQRPEPTEPNQTPEEN